MLAKRTQYTTVFIELDCIHILNLYVLYTFLSYFVKPKNAIIFIYFVKTV